MDPCLFQSISSTFQNAELATSPLEINQKCEELIQIIKESAFSLFHASYFSRAHTRDSLASLRTYIGSKQMSEAISTQFTLILSALAAIDNRRHLDSAFDAFPDKIHQCIAHRFPTISNNETDTRGTISKFESIYGHRKTFLYEKILPTWIASQNIRIEHLPFDLFNEWFFMFQYLTKINYTNKRSTFIIGLDETITTLKELTVNNELLCGTNFDISRTPKLQVLKYARAELTNGFSEQLRSLKNLTKLSLTDAALTESFINKFSAITQLKRLHIATENRIDYAFLLNMPHLITFKCQQLFSDTDTTFISALTNLESLKVHRNALSDQGIKTLCEMTKLEEIKLWNSSRITNAGMKNLNRLTALTQLNTNNCPGIDNEVLEHLSTLTNLQSLALNFCNNKQFELQPADIFKKLTHLHVEDAKLSALGFTFNTAFPNLRILNLNFCSINEPQLQSLMQSTQLVELYLRKAITSDLYKSVSFSNMRQLKKLQLSITDTPIVYDFDDFAKLTALTYLGLGSFYNKDSQISKLHSLTNLSSLHTAHIIYLTFAGLEQIARLPNLTYFKTSTELNKKHVKGLFKIGQSIDKICWDSTLTTRYSLQKTTINQL